MLRSVSGALGRAASSSGKAQETVGCPHVACSHRDQAAEYPEPFIFSQTCMSPQHGAKGLNHHLQPEQHLADLYGLVPVIASGARFVSVPAMPPDSEVWLVVCALAAAFRHLSHAAHWSE